MRYCCCPKNMKLISLSQNVMFLLLCNQADFLLYRHTCTGARFVDDFPHIQQLKTCLKVTQMLLNIFGRFLKINKDFQGRPKDVLMIHQQI